MKNYIYGDFDFVYFIFQNPTDEKIKLIIVLIKNTKQFENKGILILQNQISKHP